MSAINPTGSRVVRNLRFRSGREGSGLRTDHEDTIPLDITRDPNDNLKDILRNICGQQNVSTSRKLGHLNNFVKLLCHLSDSSLITIPMKDIMICLKGSLVSDVKEVRAATVRVLRYLINDDYNKRLFTKLHLDLLVTRCLDISHFNEVERIQAVRLIRKIAHIKRKRTDSDVEPIIPLSLMACIVSISLDGAEERDRVYRTCLAVLCELALLQPWLVVKCNGILALINAILECHMYQRINESLCLSFMHIVNHPGLRKWHLPVLDVSPTFAPFTELNYRLHPDVDESKLNEELEMRFLASKMAIVSLLRTWTGLLHICHSKNMMKSFVESLSMSNEAVRRGILSVLSELFYFNDLVWTNDFQQALKAAAPGHFRDNWRLSDGFVVAEGKSILPIKHVSRPDLVDCHLAILLSSLFEAGLLKVLTKVAISSDSYSSVSATIILGSVLHLANHLLPSGYNASSWQSALPDLLQSETSHMSIAETLRLNVAVKRLQEVSTMKNNPPKPYSVYLSQLLTKEEIFLKKTASLASPSRKRATTFSEIDTLSHSSFSVVRRNRSLNIIRDFTDNHLLSSLKITKVLSSKEYNDWDWEALQNLFLSAHSSSFLKLLSVDDTLRRFYRRLVHFYQPSSKLFSALDLAKDGYIDNNRIYVETAILIIKNLAHADEEGHRLLRSLVEEILKALPKVNAESTNYSKTAGSLSLTCSREYFLILGSLSWHAKGDTILKQCKVYYYFHRLATKETHEIHIRLLVSSLRYGEDGPARGVLEKVLKTCSESARLYATGFLRVLLRANYPGFQRWGMEILTTQLFDNSNEVALEALDILDEACDDTDYLRSVVNLRPTLLHLGERGAILVCRFMSIPQGFLYLSRNNYLNRELYRWRTEFNERYVTHVEELLKLSLTSYERANKEEGFVRRSGNRKTRQSVRLPAHLYGELCRHEAGAALVEKEEIVPTITQSLQDLIDEFEKGKKTLRKETDKKSFQNFPLLHKMKSYLWALAHIGSTIHGLPLLERCDSLNIISNLATSSPVSSIRGTCIYCLSTIAQTIPGVETLHKLGYQCVLKTTNKCDASEEAEHYSPSISVITSRQLSNEKPHSFSCQLSTTSVSSNSHKKGSSDSLSISSEITVFTATSKQNKPSKKSVSKRNRHHMRSASDVKVSSSNLFNATSQSTVFDSASDESLLPSPTRADTTLSRSTRKQSLPAVVSVQKRSKTLNVPGRTSVISSKTKLKDRFLDVFWRRSRSKSLSYGSQQDNVLSVDIGADSLIQLDSIVEQQLKPEEPDIVPVHLPTQIKVIHKSHICTSSSLLSDESASSKSTDPSKNSLKLEKFKMFTGTDMAEEGTDNPHKPDLVRLNKNNSGKIVTNLNKEIGPSDSRDKSEILALSVDSNLDNIIENSTESSVQRTTSHLDVMNVDLTDRYCVDFKNAQGRTLFDSQTDKHSLKLASETPFRYNCAESLNETYENRNASSIESASSSVDNAPSNGENQHLSVLGFCAIEARARGNTQTSYDSGVILDGNPTSVSRDNSPQIKVTDVTSSQTLLDLKKQPNALNEEDKWRFFQPKDLNVLHLVTDKEAETRSPSKNSPYKSNVLSFEERDVIIKSTRYVGIAVPNNLSDFFMPSVGQIPKIVRLNSSKLLEAQNKDEKLEKAEIMLERKVSIVRKAPKLRGLDESTFGPAIAAGFVNTKWGRMHATVTTPYGVTPNSILSETSDFCYIGGQFVEPGSEEHIALLHQEIIELVTSLASSVGVKSHETSLLMLKEKKPDIFDSIFLYNSIIQIMSEHSFRLTSRRFVQELFQDIKFTEVYSEAHQAFLTVIDK